MKSEPLRGRISELETELARIEGELATLQRAYEVKALQMQELRRLARRLASYGLPDTPAPSWAGVCRVMEWPVGGRGGHGTVKRQDPALHALLHLCVFEAYCALDRVTYAP